MNSQATTITIVGEWIFPADRSPSNWKKFTQHNDTDTHEISVWIGVELIGLVFDGILVISMHRKSTTEFWNENWTFDVEIHETCCKI